MIPGCTSFLVNMMTTPDEKLASACPQKLAEKYEVQADWVEMCLRVWRGRVR